MKVDFYASNVERHLISESLKEVHLRYWKSFFHK